MAEKEEQSTRPAFTIQELAEEIARALLAADGGGGDGGGGSSSSSSTSSSSALTQALNRALRTAGQAQVRATTRQ